MKKNMGSLDKGLRLVVAAALVVLGLTGVISGTPAIIGYLVAAVFAVTSFVSFCPAYLPFGVNTCGKR